MLQIIDLVKKYGSETAVDYLNLTIGEGEIFGFVGPNGAGKTTTMKIISGLLKPTSGRVLIKGMDVTAYPMRLKEKIGYMPDFFGVYDNLQVDEYLDFYAGTYGIPYDQRGDIISNLLELVDLSHKREAYVDKLSRGMKQRLCLARSLVHDPDILLLDEPASGLDPRARVEMKEVLKQLKTLGKTIIISSHILPELAELCTVLGIIDKGALVANGSMQDIMRQLNYRRTMRVKPLNDVEPLIKILEEQPMVYQIIENTEDVEFDFEGNDKQLANLLAQIIQNNIPILTFVEKEGDLEDIFMQVTKGGDQT